MKIFLKAQLCIQIYLSISQFSFQFSSSHSQANYMKVQFAGYLFVRSILTFLNGGPKENMSLKKHLTMYEETARYFSFASTFSAEFEWLYILYFIASENC